MLDRLDRTIVAISSAAGRSAVGIVRLSGSDSQAIVEQMASEGSQRPLLLPDRAGRVPGFVFPEPDLHLPAVFCVFRTPHSYTRQDIVEIHSIGSPVVLDMIRRRAVDLGAVPAEPGEFTARAFLNGAMDLTRAEAVAGIIRARSDSQLRAARSMMDGALSDRVFRIRDTLADVLALVEADIDFSEEPIDFITPDVLRSRLAEIGKQLNSTLTEAVSSERIDVLPRILLLGPPNAGKSSLMNVLTQTSRAICHATAGTTRDVLSAPLVLGGGEAILLDAAGVDSSDDHIASAARETALETAERVDLICVVFDIARAGEEAVFLDRIESLETAEMVIAANKIDLVESAEISAAVERLVALDLGPVCPVSARTGSGIGDLRRLLAERLAIGAGPAFGELIVLSDRQREAVNEATAAVGRAEALSTEAAATIDCADLLAFELREALDALGSVTGEVTTEDLLGRVFAGFCIGK